MLDCLILKLLLGDAICVDWKNSGLPEQILFHFDAILRFHLKNTLNSCSSFDRHSADDE
jgi:hypothetical protein